MPISLKAYAKPSKSEVPLDEVAIFALSLPSIIKYKREKRLLIARGFSSSHSRKGRGVPLSILSKQTSPQSVVLSGPTNAEIACPKSF